ncbi:zinc-ribbon domain-containing protein [[Clostridium] hylemonae]|uniref:zinc-ribbon domain-containing protein n=1 Tax=[Clostridium] hylemonae TaxID=89153 RepID=UPI00110611C2|nr:zinc-ribbon domain-containing protein [[Clostridium] hylemonae]
MGYCIKCGAKVGDGIRYCPQCGAEIPAQGHQEYTYGQDAYGQNTYGNDTYGQNAYGQDTYRQNAYGQNAYGQDTYRQEYGRQDSKTTGPGSGNRQGGGTYFDRDDVCSNKGMGVLSYLGILVLIPLLAGNKNSEYVRFHSNQGLVLFITSVVINLLSGNWVFGLHSLISFSGWWFGWIFDLIGLVLFIFAVMGIVYACRGEKKELPFIGQIHLLRRE